MSKQEVYRYAIMFFMMFIFFFSVRVIYGTVSEAIETLKNKGNEP